MIAKGGTLAATGMPAAINGNSYNADNAATAFGGQGLSYDANGNLTNDGTNTYTWDARNHLSAISGAVGASFVYDPFGRRAGKNIAGAITQFLYDGSNSVQELDGSNPPNPTANLLTGLDIDERFTRTNSSGTANFLTDNIGSVVGLANSSGSIATDYSYEPFGNTTSSGASNANSYQFTGRENDGTGLYFYRNRYYSSTFQRFVAQDPIGFRGGDLDLYGYVGNSPINKRDPSGAGGAAVAIVWGACTLYNAIDKLSMLTQTAQLEAQLVTINQEESNLAQQTCPLGTNSDEYDIRRERVLSDLEKEKAKLTDQYVTEHASDMASGLTDEAKCTATASLAVLIPEP